jgi:HAE1 family hydrophobic/amphiphilic exporter-1
MTAPIGKTVLGGLSFGTLMTLFLMPTIYAVFNKRSDERAARAEARRERIAAGLTRKQAKQQSLSGQGAASIGHSPLLTPPTIGPEQVGEAGI